jgi:hypothetical protein
MPKCIFCENELTPDTKPEHVLLSALGGRMTTRGAICSEHNNEFGGSVDKALAAQVEIIRNLLQLQTGTKKPPPPLKNLTAGTEKISAFGDGSLRLETPPFEVTDLSGGRFDGRSWSSLKRNSTIYCLTWPHGSGCRWSR